MAQLHFIDWNNYIDENGSSQVFDWNNLRGMPLYIGLTAIIDAINERMKCIFMPSGGPLNFDPPFSRPPNKNESLYYYINQNIYKPLWGFFGYGDIHSVSSRYLNHTLSAWTAMDGIAPLKAEWDETAMNAHFGRNVTDIYTSDIQIGAEWLIDQKNIINLLQWAFLGNGQYETLPLIYGTGNMSRMGNGVDIPIAQASYNNAAWIINPPSVSDPLHGSPTFFRHLLEHTFQFPYIQDGQYVYITSSQWVGIATASNNNCTRFAFGEAKKVAAGFPYNNPDFPYIPENGWGIFVDNETTPVNINSFFDNRPNLTNLTNNANINTIGGYHYSLTTSDVPHLPVHGGIGAKITDFKFI